MQKDVEVAQLEQAKNDNDFENSVQTSFVSDVRNLISEIGNQVKEIDVTKEEFEKYEKVRASGRTNMFDLKTVSILSGLDREKIRAIIENFEALMKIFPDVYGKFDK